MPLREGQQVGPYVIKEQLGQGGMAIVYRAYHARLDRYVAIKVLHTLLLNDPTLKARFEREAQIIARLKHPNIVPVYDFNEFEGQLYLVMQQIEGQPLKVSMTNKPMPLSDTIRIMTIAAGALDYAHEKGVMHRDIKPSNIILDDEGAPHLMDFGLARLVHAGPSTLSADAVLGTPQYMSPEQARGVGDLDRRTDIYSFGIVLYEMITGRVPFNGMTPLSIIHNHINDPVPKPTTLNPKLPIAVENVLLKALAKKPADRYSTTMELMDAFRAAAEKKRSTQPIARTQENTSEVAQQSSSLNSVLLQMREHFKATRGHVRRKPRRPETAVPGTKQVKITHGHWQKAPYIPAQRVADKEWGMGEQAVNRRVQERLGRRTSLVQHAAIYGAVIVAIFLAWGQLMLPSIQSALSSAPAWLGQLIGQLPVPLIAAMLGGVGLVNHFVDYLAHTSGRVEARRRAIFTEMQRIYGNNWGQGATNNDYLGVRKSVTRRFNRRMTFFHHFVTYLITNVMIAIVWSSVLPALQSASLALQPILQLPIPLIIAILWGIWLVVDGLKVVFSPLLGDEARERAHEQQIARKRKTGEIPNPSIASRARMSANDRRRPGK